MLTLDICCGLETQTDLLINLKDLTACNLDKKSLLAIVKLITLSNTTDINSIFSYNFKNKQTNYQYTHVKTLATAHKRVCDGLTFPVYGAQARL